MPTFTPGDKVVDPLSFDGVGTVVAVRSSDGMYASGRLRSGTRTLRALVEFTRPKRVGMRVQHGHSETFTRWVATNELVHAATEDR